MEKDKRLSGVDITNPEIGDVWEKVRDDNDPTNWVLLHCPNKTEINVLSTGSSGLDGLMAQLDPSKCLYGGIRANINGMIKFYSFYCAGEDVSAVQKGKNALYKNGVLIALTGLHGELIFPEGTQTPKEAIIAQIMKMSDAKADMIRI